jgi:hypothetical protein
VRALARALQWPSTEIDAEPGGPQSGTRSEPVSSVGGLGAEASWELRKVRVHLREVDAMAWAVSLVLVVVWLMGLVTGHTLRGFVHLLPVCAVAVVTVARGRLRRARSG